jgi:hypothetical protein
MSYQPLFLGLGTAVVRTTALTGYLEAETANLTVGQPIIFQSSNSSPLVGGVTANVIHFVKEIIDDNNFTVSVILDGPALELEDDTGFMLVRSIQKENTSESLRKVDEMLQEIYAGGIDGDGVGILSVIEDTAPQLGGNLSLNTNSIVGTGDIDISGTISATTITGGLRGIVAGGLIGPVDEDGLRIGNPTIDGLPFELGNPQANQIIAWSVSGQKFVLASLQAASGTDTLDDVLFRGNSSAQSIDVNGVTTTNLTVTNGIDYADLINTPSIPAAQVQSDWAAVSGLGVILNKPTLATVATSGSYADLTNKPTLFSGSYADLTNKPSLATVATSGSYADLTNKPTIPSTLLGLGISDGTVGQVLTTNGSGTFTFTTVSGGGGTSLGSRTNVSATTGALLVNATGNISITGFKTYALLGMTVEIPAWVRLYTTAAARTADASRLETEDPLPGSGVIAEVITTSNNQTVLFTPATLGFNGDAPAATTIYASVKNKGSGLATIQVTLTLVQLEA